MKRKIFKMKLQSLYLTSLLFFCLQLKGAEYNILDFGAKPDGTTLNTQAINNAVNKCFENGGGTVLVPAGTYVTGTIVLKSNVKLHLKAGAVLEFLQTKYKALIYKGNISFLTLKEDGQSLKIIRN